MPAPKSLVRYKVSAPIHAVQLAEHPGSSLRDPTETLIRIPIDAVIYMEGTVSPSGLATALWNNLPYSIFYDDLTEKAQLLNAATP